MQDEAKAPRFKPKKDRGTLIMYESAGGFVIKPWIIYRSNDVRAPKEIIMECAARTHNEKKCSILIGSMGVSLWGSNVL